jgi:hypothetical protein
MTDEADMYCEHADSIDENGYCPICDAEWGPDEAARSEERRDRDNLIAVAQKAINDIQAERRRAAGICVAEARACNRVIVSEGIAAALALQQGKAWAATASVEQMSLHRGRRDALISAARKIMGK